MDSVTAQVTTSPHAGKLAGATVVGTSGTPGNGPYSRLFLQLADARIEAASFQTYGCGHAIACCSKLCELITGRSTEEALAVTAEQLAAALGGLPRSKRHCAPLAIAALQDALSQPATGGAHDASA